jgi:hypothetical protein
MKTMTCEQLGGACDEEFCAETFLEIGEMSKRHASKMFEAGEPAHLAAMQAMSDLMQNPEAMANWFENKQKEFDSLPDNVDE